MPIKLNGSGSGSVALNAPANTSGGSDISFTLPTADGTSGQVLQTNGSGALSFASASSDNITEGNTSAEVVDTGSNGHFKVTTEGTERLRVDSSGRVGIGSSTNLGYKVNFYESGTGMINTLHLGSGSGSAGNGASISFGLGNGFDPTNNILAKIGGIYTGGGYDGALTFHTCSNTSQGANPPERMRINSNGNILIGTTTENGRGLTLYSQFSGSSGGIAFSKNNDGNANACAFINAGSVIGTISYDTTSTAYNTSSDYRLKENITAVTDGITRLQQLKPSRFNFIADPDHTVDGFIAHEVQAVVPEAINGEKDAVDDDGNPIYQGIDQSKLVPLLTAALQEALAKLETLEAANAALEARLTALEGGAS